MATNFADEARARLAPVMSDDLATYVDGLGEMFREIEEFAREADDGSLPWAPITNIDRALGEASLVYLAQLAGVRVPQGLSEASMKVVIERAEARRRGRLDYMVELAKSTLTGTKTVITMERSTSAWTLRILTRTSETPDPAATEAAIRRGKPAGIVLDYAAVAGITWDEAVSQWNSATVTWDQSVSTVP